MFWEYYLFVDNLLAEWIFVKGVAVHFLNLSTAKILMVLVVITTLVLEPSVYDENEQYCVQRY